MELVNKNISCPYCGESIEILIDDSVSEQDYYEDCSVCCRPIRFQLRVEYSGESRLSVLRDDE